jgi:hypothetical protein
MGAKLYSVRPMLGALISFGSVLNEVNNLSTRCVNHGRYAHGERENVLRV